MVRMHWLHSFALVAALLTAGCASPPRYVWYSEVPREPKLASRTHIEPGDRILVHVAEHPNLSGEFVIGASGTYSHPVVGVVDVAGADTSRVAAFLKEALSRYVQVTNISVTLVAYRPMSITVLGKVVSTGAYELPPGSGLLTALAKAGGLTPFASEDQVYVLRAQPQPLRIRFRYSDLTRPEAAAIGFQLRDGDTIVVE